MKRELALPFPPRLSMDAYIRYIADNWEFGNVALMQRQKAIEENIRKPFRMPGSQPLSEENGLLVHEGAAVGDLSGAVDSDRDRRNQGFVK